MRGTRFYEVLKRLIGGAEAARCLGRICDLNKLDEGFYDQITNTEALHSTSTLPLMAGTVT